MFENYIRIYLILSLLTATTYMAGQEDFSTLYKAKDPSPTDINHDQRRIIHQQFLDSVSATNDTTAIILGNFYLANDYVIG